MSFYNLYVGDAFDPKFHWEGGDYSGNTPAIILDLGSIGLSDCVAAMSLLTSPEYGGRALDWGATGALMCKARVIGFVIQLFESNPCREARLALIDTLEEDRDYVLFACEQ